MEKYINKHFLKILKKDTIKDKLIRKSKRPKLQVLKAPELDGMLNEAMSEKPFLIRGDKSLKFIQQQLLNVLVPLALLWARTTKADKKKMKLKAKYISKSIEKSILPFVAEPQGKPTKNVSRRRDVATLEIRFSQEIVNPKAALGRKAGRPL